MLDFRLLPFDSMLMCNIHVYVVSEQNVCANRET